MVERQRRAGLQTVDRDAALDLAYHRKGEQLADQEFLIMRQVGHDDFEQIIDGAGNHVAGDHLGHGEHRVLEAAGTLAWPSMRTPTKTVKPRPILARSSDAR